jgi:hypothetical protein
MPEYSEILEAMLRAAAADLDGPAGALGVPLATGLVLAGEKSRSTAYDEVARALPDDRPPLEYIHDGRKTLVTLRSILRRHAALPRGIVSGLAPKWTKPRAKKARRKEGQR